jgi:hypothetical protein
MMREIVFKPPSNIQGSNELWAIMELGQISNVTGNSYRVEEIVLDEEKEEIIVRVTEPVSISKTIQQEFGIKVEPILSEQCQQCKVKNECMESPIVHPECRGWL